MIKVFFAYNTDYIAIVKLIKEYQLDKKSKGLSLAVVVWLKLSSQPLKTVDLSILKIFARNRKTGKNLASLYGW